jgi:serine/threonine-protein kinase
MSPEQAIGERDIDGRSDVYSLGVVGYQMLTGELPFSANNTPSMLMKHINQAPRPIRELRPDIPAGLERGIERAMAKQPDQRWTDASAFRDALADDSPRVPAVSVAPAPPRQAADPSVAVAPWQQPQPPSMHRAVRDVVPQNNHVPAPPVPPRPQLPSWMPPPQAAPLAQPAIPQWMPADWHEARKQWRQYDKEQKRLFREQFREQRRQRGRGLMAPEQPPGQEIPVEYRIRSFRMQVARVGTTAAILAGINFATAPGVPWFLIPAGVMSLSLLKRGSTLWAEGIRWKDIFGKDARLPATSGQGQPPMPALGAPPRNMVLQRAAALVPAEVLQGPHGGHVLRAAEDEQSIIEAIGKLSKTDREMIPDVKPTVESLVERIAALAQGLHRLDHDVTIEALQRLDERIAAASAEPDGSDREKKLTLLRRQRETLGDLRGRRDSLATQLESTSLMLQNIRIDLIALRAAGVQSSIDDASSATQEARALSRDIGHVLEAAKQVRD